jgi:N-acetylglucosaminyldiphosphoundecaprenol N-acetyl-beta-D-mannosaminyltransferase
VRPRDQGLLARASLGEVLRGEASLVGSRTTAGHTALGLRPGVVSPYELRESVGLRYGDPAVEEARWERDRTPLRDAALIGRFLLSGLLAPRGGEAPRRIRILGVLVDALDTGETIDRIVAFARAGESRSVFFVHPHALNLAAGDPSLREAMARADLVLPDGSGLRVAASLLGTPLPANLNGTDLVPELLVELAVSGIPVALLGGAPGVAHRAAEVFRRRYGVAIAGARSGFGDPASHEEWIAELSAKGPAVVLVGTGSPLQEKLVDERLRGRAGLVSVTVGGLFDFVTEDKPRAPLALREMGLEWSFRLAVEPGRLARRYLVGNPQFLWRVLRQRWTGEER